MCRSDIDAIMDLARKKVDELEELKENALKSGDTSAFTAAVAMENGINSLATAIYIKFR